MTITISYVIDSLYMDKKRYSEKEMHNYTVKCTLSCIIRTLEVMITTEKNTLTSWRGLCIFLQWAPSLLFEQLLLRIFISHFFPIVFTWWHTRQWLWNTPFPTKKSHTISILTLHRLWLKNKLFPKRFSAQAKLLCLPTSEYCR